MIKSVKWFHPKQLGGGIYILIYREFKSTSNEHLSLCNFKVIYVINSVRKNYLH